MLKKLNTIYWILFGGKKIVQLSLNADTEAIRRLTISTNQSNAECSGTDYDAITVNQNAFLYDTLIRPDLIRSNNIMVTAVMVIYTKHATARLTAHFIIIVVVMDA